MNLIKGVVFKAEISVQRIQNINIVIWNVRIFKGHLY